MNELDINIQLDEYMGNIPITRDIIDLKTGNLLCGKNQIITKEMKKKLVQFQHSDVYVDGWANEWKISHEEIRVFDKQREQLKELYEQIVEDQEVDIQEVHQITENVMENIEKNNILVGYVNKIKSIDEYTYGHCMNVGILSVLIGKWLGLNEYHLDKLLLAGLLHDVGKYKVNQAILNKKGKLTLEEYEIVKEHAALSYQLVKGKQGIEEAVAQGIYSHHERIDGSGYPRKLEGGRIPLYGRIIAVADVYDAMISQRVYKEKVSPFKVMEQLMQNELNRLDPKIMLPFLKQIANYYTGIKVELSNGVIGKVVFIQPHCIYRPIVKVKDEYINLYKRYDLEIVQML